MFSINNYSLKFKILLSIALVFLIILAVVVGYSSVSTMQFAKKDAIARTELLADNLADDLKARIDYTFDASRNLADFI